MPVITGEVVTAEAGGGGSIGPNPTMPPIETIQPPQGGGQLTVTLDDMGKTIHLKVGDNFLLELGDQYQWDVSISDQSVLDRVKGILVVKGAQGVYEALQPGTVTLEASGDPACRQSQPPCMMPSRLFELTVVVE